MSRFFQALLVLCCAAMLAQADKLHLKGGAVIEGKLLAEKEEVLVVDIGYTVLTLNRAEVQRIERTGAPIAQTVAKAKGLYTVAAKPPPLRPVKQLVEALGVSVVQVKTPGGLGSGFIIREDGHLITNFHVIEGETRISVEVYHQRDGQLERKTYRKVRIVAMNKFADLALLQITEKDAPKFHPVPLAADPAKLEVGERVFAIGSPLGLERTVTEGIVSTRKRQMEGALYLQTSTPINPGNSGGPLFNLRGEVVGVTNMKISSGENLGFAIPVDRVIHFLQNRDAFAYDNDNPSNAYRYLPPPRKPRKTPTAP